MRAAASLFDIIWAGHDDNPGLYAALESFVSERIWGASRGFGQGRAMAVINGDAVIAAAIFNNWDSRAGVIEISAAADSSRWITRPVLKALFEYPFIALGCQAVAMRSEESNSAVSRIAVGYGFKKYDIPRLGGRDVTQSIYVLSDDDWRGNKFNRVKKHGFKT